MSMIYLALSLFIISASALINQEKQKHEISTMIIDGNFQSLKNQQAIDQRQKTLQAMQNLIAIIKNRDTNAQRKLTSRSYRKPPPNPRGIYGNFGSSSESLASFANNHNPDIRCDGWVPISVPLNELSNNYESINIHREPQYDDSKILQAANDESLNLIVVPDITTSNLGAHSSSASFLPSSNEVSLVNYGLPKDSNFAVSSFSSSAKTNSDEIQNHKISSQKGHEVYGVPTNSEINIDSLVSSYDPPPSGMFYSEDVHHTNHVNGFQTIPSIGGENDLQLPEVNPSVQFNNAIGTVSSSTLDLSTGTSEVVKSNTIHESHTSEVAHTNIIDSYSAPPLDSYAPGKYTPSFATRRPMILMRPMQYRVKTQYNPIINPRIKAQPPPNFRPIPSSGLVHSIDYEQQSTNSDQIQQFSFKPRQPLLYRKPVPMGLLQEIGQKVEAQDSRFKGYVLNENRHLASPTNEIKFQENSHGTKSSSLFSLQNKELKNVQIIHDCGKGQHIHNNEDFSTVLSTNYEVPPPHKTINFNLPPTNSYLEPPLSDAIDLESRQNIVIAKSQSIGDDELNESSAGGSLSSSQIDRVLAKHSHLLPDLENKFQIDIQNFDQNKADGSDHQQILADGLLQSILTAIEQRQLKKLPQVIENKENDHNDAKIFLKSREGQKVL